MPQKKNGYAMLIMLLIVILIISYLVVAKGSPLSTWFSGEGRVSNQSLKQQTEQLKVDVNKVNQQKNDELKNELNN